MKSQNNINHCIGLKGDPCPGVRVDDDYNIIRHSNTIHVPMLLLIATLVTRRVVGPSVELPLNLFECLNDGL